MNILELLAYGTSEGVKKEWDTRGRKAAVQVLLKRGFALGTKSKSHASYYKADSGKAAKYTGHKVIVHSSGAWEHKRVYMNQAFPGPSDSESPRGRGKDAKSLAKHLDGKDPRYEGI